MRNDVTARLAQSAERKALNLMVVGSSPTVGVCFILHHRCRRKVWAALAGVVPQALPRGSPFYLSLSLSLLLRLSATQANERVCWRRSRRLAEQGFAHRQLTIGLLVEYIAAVVATRAPSLSATQTNERTG